MVRAYPPGLAEDAKKNAKLKWKDYIDEYLVLLGRSFKHSIMA